MSKPQDAAETKQAHSPWSFRIATIAGIPVRLHFTFILFMAWVAFSGYGRASLWPLLVLSLFVCVVLHEFGHALTARRYGIETRDITLYPIGGVAMITGRPTPKQELWIALAGPAVNLVIAAVLYVVIALTSRGAAPIDLTIGRAFLPSLLAANLTLAIFNLVPAFPMDGGRVLRAALALAMPEAKATAVAAAIGQALAITVFLLALLPNTPFSNQPILMLIALFVFLGAGQEASSTQTRSFLEGHKVADAMQTRFRTITNGASLEAAAEMLLAGSQHDFPVVAGDEVVGVLTRSDIARGLATDGPTGYVAAHMRRDFQTASPTLPLEKVAELFGSQDGGTPVLVLEEGALQGMVTSENLGEFIMLEHARAQVRRGPYVA